MGFLTNLFKGILISVIGSVIVYIVVFVIISGKPVKNLKDVKTMLNDMVNVKEKIAQLNNRSGLMADKIELQEAANNAASEDQKSEIQKTLALIDQQLKVSENSRNRIETEDEFTQPADSITPTDFQNVKKDLSRLQKQLDRIENNNRLLTLQIRLLQKQNEQLILQNKSARK